MVRGEIYLARFPFGGSGGAKTRPALLLTGPVGSVPEYLTAYISSAIPPVFLLSDLLLDPAEDAGIGLKQASIVRLHKLSTLHERDLFRRLGVLSPAVILEVENRLRTLLSL